MEAKNNIAIWIDIYHIPQLNFYLPLMRLLTAKGFTVYLTVLNRGRLVRIVKSDLERLGLLTEKNGETGKVVVSVVGRHRMNRWSVIFEANFLRIIELGWWRLLHKVDVCFTNGFHATLWSRVFGNPSYTFGDDPDTFDYRPKLWWATKVHFCLVDQYYVATNSRTTSNDVVIVPCLKEWASLAPGVFNPDISQLHKFGVKPKEYLFLREVSVGTINYTCQASGAVRNIQHMIPKDKKVLFSLEEKHRRKEYPEDWILLQEPVEDIHSLIYYSAGLVSSGDSMAREAALLGVPAYYLGIRHSMPANLAASNVASLHNELTMPFDKWVTMLDDSIEDAIAKQDERRRSIDDKFIDINQYMMDLVEKHIK